MLFLSIGALLLSALLFYQFTYKRNHKLRVLMYHKVDESLQDSLTVSTKQLDQHLYYLRQRGYHFLSIADLTASTSLPSNGILLTFDDAYFNNLEYAYPLLKEHGARATIFVPTAYIGKSSEWDIIATPLMTVEHLLHLDPNVFELGLHSHTHPNYAALSEKELQEDLSQNIQFFHKHQLPFVPAFAYPYGARPKDKIRKRFMVKCMKEMGVTMAFRIGNRLNTWPFQNRYEIQRIDIRGTDTFEDFVRKVKWGKLF